MNLSAPKCVLSSHATRGLSDVYRESRLIGSTAGELTSWTAVWKGYGA
jgi:hypothetical protein